MIFLHIALAVLVMAAAPQRADIASIQGSVREAESGGPLNGVIIEARRVDSPGKNYSYVVLTSGNGTFELPQVTPGDYRLTAKSAGYFPLEYGQHTPYGSGLTFHVGAGESKRNIRISLTRGGVITGRVLNKDGDPATTVMIQAIEVSNRAGQLAYTVAQSTFANDLGEYRLFELHPGRYLVSVRDHGILSSFNLANTSGNAEILDLLSRSTNGTTLISSSNVQLAPVFYPGTADPREASTISVSPGAIVSGINMTVVPSASHHIRGVATGTNVQVQIISLTPTPGSSATSRPVFVSNGTFDIANVSAGRYLLRAQTLIEEARMVLDVRDQDIDAVFLEPRPGVVIPTQVRIAGLTGSAQENAYPFIRFRPMSDPPIPGVSGAIYSTLPDGSVNFDLNPGENIRISLFPVNDAPPLLQDAYIQSIRVGTQDVLNNGLTYSGDPQARMEITIGLSAGTVLGMVSEEDAGIPAVNTIVVLVPDSAMRGRSDAYRTGRTDESGQFRITHVPPGDYKVFAWNDADDGQWLDPDFLINYEQKGTPIHVEESSRESVSVRVLQ